MGVAARHGLYWVLLGRTIQVKRLFSDTTFSHWVIVCHNLGFHQPGHFRPTGAFLLSGTGTTVAYEITFGAYTGLVQPIVADTSELVAESGAVVVADIVTLEEGTEPLRGDFTLAFRGQETPSMSYDVAADQVRAPV